jgi:hypothetical protein
MISMAKRIYSFLLINFSGRTRKKIIKETTSYLFLVFLIIGVFFVFKNNSLWLNKSSNQNIQNNPYLTEDNFHVLSKNDKIKFKIPNWAQSVRIQLIPVLTQKEKTTNSQLLKTLNNRIFRHSFAIKMKNLSQQRYNFSSSLKFMEDGENLLPYFMVASNENKIREKILKNYSNLEQEFDFETTHLTSSTDIVLPTLLGHGGEMEISDFSNPEGQALSTVLLKVWVRESLTEKNAREQFHQMSYWKKLVTNPLLNFSQNIELGVQKEKLREQAVLALDEKYKNLVSVEKLTPEILMHTNNFEQSFLQSPTVSTSFSFPLRAGETIFTKPLNSDWSHIKIEVSARSSAWPKNLKPTLVASRDGRAILNPGNANFSELSITEHLSNTKSVKFSHDISQVFKEKIGVNSTSTIDMLVPTGKLSLQTNSNVNIKLSKVVWFDEYGEPVTEPVPLEASSIDAFQSEIGQSIDYSVLGLSWVKILGRCAQSELTAPLPSVSPQKCPLHVKFLSTQGALVEKIEITDQVLEMRKSQIKQDNLILATSAVEFIYGSPDLDLSIPTPAWYIKVPKNSSLMSVEAPGTKMILNVEGNADKTPVVRHLIENIPFEASEPLKIKQSVQSWSSLIPLLQGEEFQQSDKKIYPVSFFTNVEELNHQLQIEPSSLFAYQELLPLPSSNENTNPTFSITAFEPLSLAEKIEVQRYWNQTNSYPNLAGAKNLKTVISPSFPLVWEKIAKNDSYKNSQESEKILRLRGHVSGRLNWWEFPSFQQRSIVIPEEVSKNKEIELKPQFGNSEFLFVEGLPTNGETKNLWKKITLTKASQGSLKYRVQKQSPKELIVFNYFSTNPDNFNEVSIELKTQNSRNKIKTWLSEGKHYFQWDLGKEKLLTHLENTVVARSLEAPLFFSNQQPSSTLPLQGSLLVGSDVPVGSYFDVVFNAPVAIENKDSYVSIFVLQPGQTPRKTLWIESEGELFAKKQNTEVNVESGLEFTKK